MLELTDLHKRYGDVVALDGVSFTVRPGRMLGFLGPNGAGKTTTMRAVFGLVRLDRGTVTWRGSAIDDATRRRFGYLPEQRGLYPKMRIADQLVYLGRLHGMAPDDAAAEADRWLARLGLAERSRDRLEQLSHGNQQRVQLAAALVHRPELLVLDEPFSGLDPLGVDDMEGVLREAAAEGVAVVFSSHQLELVEGLCDDVAIIASGRLALEGDVDSLKRGSTFRILEIGRPGRPEAVDRLEGVIRRRANGFRQRLVVDAATDPAAVLEAIGGAEHFAYTPPALEDLFREAVGMPLEDLEA
ncbi:MAG: ATP-binding cassette domain-containing protein [Acidimicrobiia bacterium]